jgi:hypothetical protein
MRDLNPSDWIGVTYISDGEIYVNRATLKNILEVARPLNNNLYQLSDGSIIPRMQPDVSSKFSSQSTVCNISTGPSRRVKTAVGLSQVTPGTKLQRFAYAKATISPAGLILGNDNPPFLNRTAGVSEVAYAYLGASSSGANSGEADAGVQWSTSTLSVGSTWVPAVLVDGSFITGKPPYAAPTRYGWYSGVTMEFAVLTDGKARIIISGSVATGSPTLTNPYKIDFNVRNIKKDGTKNILKRLQTIAQQQGSAPVNNPSSKAIYNLAWSNMLLGLSAQSGDFHTWGTFSTDQIEDCVTSSSKIQIASLGTGAEEIAFDLR